MSEPTNRPNIKFTGRDVRDKKTRKLLKRVLPVRSFIHQTATVELPDTGVQIDARKFYHPEARTIRRLFPHLYKLIKPRKGAK